VPIFDSVDPASLRLLAFTSQRMMFEPGQVLMHQGAESDEGYVIISGSADVLVEAGGLPVKIAEVGRHDFVGDIAMFCDRPRTATVVATSQVDTLLIKRVQFMELMEHAPRMAIEIMRVLADRLSRANQELARARS
jgi:CRP-like cAMP-binding protein